VIGFDARVGLATLLATEDPTAMLRFFRTNWVPTAEEIPGMPPPRFPPPPP
jgi:hypothetical protein